MLGYGLALEGLAFWTRLIRPPKALDLGPRLLEWGTASLLATEPRVV